MIYDFDFARFLRSLCCHGPRSFTSVYIIRCPSTSFHGDVVFHVRRFVLVYFTAWMRILFTALPLRRATWSCTVAYPTLPHDCSVSHVVRSAVRLTIPLPVATCNFVPRYVCPCLVLYVTMVRLLITAAWVFWHGLPPPTPAHVHARGLVLPASPRSRFVDSLLFVPRYSLPFSTFTRWSDLVT